MTVALSFSFPDDADKHLFLGRYVRFLGRYVRFLVRNSRSLPKKRIL